MQNYTWAHSGVNVVSCNGANYLYSLLLDYERYINDFGFIPLRNFIYEWKCVTYKAFSELHPGDYVYTPYGQRYRVMEEPYESDDEDSLYVEVVEEKDDGTYDATGRSNQVVQTGDVYSENVIHDHYRWKQKIRRGEEKLCPILITETKQPQS